MTAAATVRTGRAQDSGPTTRGEARSRPVGESRPQDEFDLALKDLARASTAGEAGIKAAALLGKGEIARTRILDFLRGREATDAVFEGVVSAFDVTADASVVPVLFEVYGRGSAARDQFVSFVFKKFDRRDSLLEPALRLFESAAGSDARRRSLRILSEVADDPGERLRVAQRLVEDLQSPRDGAIASDLRASLTQITFHDFPDATAWKDWFEKFLAVNPTGFSEAALYRSSLKQKDQRFLQEVQRNIDASVAEKRPPLRYLDRRAYPEAVVRRYAARMSAELRGAETEIVKKTVDALLLLLADEKDDETAAEALTASGELAGRDADLAPRVAAAARTRLGADAPAMVAAALRALARVGTLEDLPPVEALYDALVKKDDMLEARVQLVSTLYALNGGYATMIRALEDPKPTVRAAAARVLSFAKKTTAVPQIAAALSRETAAEPQLSMVKALASLETWDESSVAAISVVVENTSGLVRDQALRALLQAAASSSFPPTAVEATVRLLAAVAPSAHTAEDKRAALLAEVRPVDSHVEFLIRWLAVEGDLAAARDIAQRLAKVGADRPERLAAAAVELRASGRKEACPILLRAAYAAVATGSSTTTRRTRPEEAAAALLEALTEEGSPAGLEEASALADRMLVERPSDVRFLLLRGGVREARGDAAGAAVDLAATLKSEGGPDGDVRRDIERRLLAALLVSGKTADAQAFLASLPAGNRNRDFLLIAAQVEAAAGRRREAVRHLRNAVKADGRALAVFAEFELARLLTGSPEVEERLEAGRIFDQFESSSGRLPEGCALLELRVPVETDRRVKTVLVGLDAAADDATRAARVAELVAVGPAAAVWVVDGLPALAEAGAAGAVRARLAVLRKLYPTDAGLSVVADPPPEATREAVKEAAVRVVEWWKDLGR